MQLTAEHWFFYPFALFALVCAVGVISARNPLHSALFLVSSFFFLAGIYILLGAHLVGALQIIVYAGAIMVLFLFVIMLLALTDADLGHRRITGFKVVGGVAALGMVGMLLYAIGIKRGTDSFLIAYIPELPYKAMPRDFGTVAAVGRVLFNENMLQFEAVSLLLLVAIAGAVVVAKGRI